MKASTTVYLERAQLASLKELSVRTGVPMAEMVRVGVGLVIGFLVEHPDATVADVAAIHVDRLPPGPCRLCGGDNAFCSACDGSGTAPAPTAGTDAGG